MCGRVSIIRKSGYKADPQKALLKAASMQSTLKCCFFPCQIENILNKHLYLFYIDILDYIFLEKFVNFPPISVFLKPRDSIPSC